MKSPSLKARDVEALAFVQSPPAATQAQPDRWNRPGGGGWRMVGWPAMLLVLAALAWVLFPR